MRSLSIARAVAVAAIAWIKSSTFSPTPKEPPGKHTLVEDWIKERDFALVPSRGDDRSDTPSDGLITQCFEHYFREAG